MLLFFLLVVPTVGIYYGLLEKNFDISGLLTSQSMGLILSSIPFAWSLNVIYTLFDFSTNQFQFVQESIHLGTFDFYIGLDGISLFFIILTVIIIPIAILSNWWSISENRPSFIIIILSLETLLLLIFLVLDVLLFYIFFESILPPLFILIGLFGSYDRVRASFYLFLYTLLGSLFLLLSILSMNSIMDTTDFDTLYKSNFDYLIQLLLFYGIFIAFAVKTPTIFLNTWLLRAHVESPLGGSIILAGVVLKLSLYGIIRLILGILPKASIEYTYIIYLIAIITIFYASLSTLRTIDVKELIAYSSVSHAAVYILGVFSNVIQGIEGSIILGLAHGFVSPGLFICAGGVLYDRSSTRLITFYKGMAQIMPLFAILFFILSLGNCGAPLTLNFIGEFLSLYGSFERLPLLGVFASSSIVFAAAYTIYMYNRISFGGILSRFFTVNISDLNKREFNLLLTLVILTVMLGIYTVPLLDGLHYSVSSFIYLFDANSISCDGPIVWSIYFKDNINKCLNIGEYSILIMENKYLFLVTVLISLYILSLLRWVLKNTFYRYKLYLTKLYIHAYDTIYYNPYSILFLFNCVIFVKMGIFDTLSNISHYFADFYVLSTEFKENLFEFIGLTREDFYRVINFIFGIDNESLLGLSVGGSDCIYEDSSTPSSQNENNIFCSSNNSNANGSNNNSNANGSNNNSNTNGSSNNSNMNGSSNNSNTNGSATNQNSSQQNSQQSNGQQPDGQQPDEQALINDICRTLNELVAESCPEHEWELCHSTPEEVARDEYPHCENPNPPHTALDSNNNFYRCTNCNYVSCGFCR